MFGHSLLTILQGCRVNLAKLLYMGQDKWSVWPWMGKLTNQQAEWDDANDGAQTSREREMSRNVIGSLAQTHRTGCFNGHILHDLSATFCKKYRHVWSSHRQTVQPIIHYSFVWHRQPTNDLPPSSLIITLTSKPTQMASDVFVLLSNFSDIINYIFIEIVTYLTASKYPWNYISQKSLFVKISRNPFDWLLTELLT